MVFYPSAWNFFIFWTFQTYRALYRLQYRIHKRYSTPLWVQFVFSRTVARLERVHKGEFPEYLCGSPWWLFRDETVKNLLEIFFSQFRENLSPSPLVLWLSIFAQYNMSFKSLRVFLLSRVCSSRVPTPFAKWLRIHHWRSRMHPWKYWCPSLHIPKAQYMSDSLTLAIG